MDQSCICSDVSVSYEGEKCPGLLSVYVPGGQLGALVKEIHICVAAVLAEESHRGSKIKFGWSFLLLVKTKIAQFFRALLFLNVIKNCHFMSEFPHLRRCLQLCLELSWSRHGSTATSLVNHAAFKKIRRYSTILKTHTSGAKSSRLSRQVQADF